MQLKRDDQKQGWETSEYPLTCETCLGDNAYVRMTKEDHCNPCKICEKPFTVFRWKAGSKGRFKSVVICQTCAKMKNVCQCCIFDLQYGLPVQLRDRVLEEHGSAGSVVAVPQSDANREWYAAQHALAVAQGTANAGNEEANKVLMRLARKGPQYERNLPKVCSFFSKGECNRGDRCPFRHEMPREGSNGNMDEDIRNRFYGKNDNVAAGMADRASERAKARIAPPSDPNVMTLWLGNLESAGGANEDLLRSKFAVFGDLVSVRTSRDGSCAFVEFSSRAAAELACASSQELDINGVRIVVNWALPKRKEGGNGNLNTSTAAKSNPNMTPVNFVPSAQPVAPMSSSSTSDTDAQDASANSADADAPNAPNDAHKNTTQPEEQIVAPAPVVPPMPAAPPGFVAFKPSPAVMEAALAGKTNTGSRIMRPGGAIRRPSGIRATPAPYYPSADSNRLGGGNK